MNVHGCGAHGGRILWILTIFGAVVANRCRNGEAPRTLLDTSGSQLTQLIRLQTAAVEAIDLVDALEQLLVTQAIAECWPSVRT